MWAIKAATRFLVPAKEKCALYRIILEFFVANTGAEQSDFSSMEQILLVLSQRNVTKIGCKVDFHLHTHFQLRVAWKGSIIQLIY